MEKEKKPKASENKAKDVEKKARTEKLWAEFGKLAAQRERALEVSRQSAQQMNEIMAKLNKEKQ